MNTRRKKGMSLAEICVVLAVISITALMVSSFTVMVGARSAVSAAKLKVMEDTALAESLLDGWIYRMTGENAVVITQNDELKAVMPGNVMYIVKLEDGMLTAPLPEGKQLAVELSTVNAISVEELRSGGDAIFFCTVTYPDPRGGDEDQTYTFCINPRVGETVDS